jgi:hypothetical protein
MPHYKNGRAAHVGDEVIGQGYNVKHPITGVVVGITPGASSCNVEVAHARLRRSYQPHKLEYPAMDVEYGQADAFEHVDDFEKRIAAEKESAAAKRDELAGEVKDLLQESPPLGLAAELAPED